MYRAWAVLVVVLGLAAFGFQVYVQTNTIQHVTATVTDKARIVNSDGKGSKYLIFTNKETFEDTDSLLNMKFNSSDVYGSITKGDTCTFTVYGYRIPIISMYRNIIKASCGKN